MRKTSNPTESAAVGSVDKDIARAREAAQRYLTATPASRVYHAVSGLYFLKNFKKCVDNGRIV